jgi:hypothetical protein
VVVLFFWRKTSAKIGPFFAESFFAHGMPVLDSLDCDRKNIVSPAVSGVALARSD